MTEELLKKGIEEATAEIKKSHQGFVDELKRIQADGGTTKELCEKAMESLEKQEKSLKALQEQLDAIEIERNRPGYKAGKVQSFQDMLVDNMTKHATTMLALKDDGAAKGFSMDMKAAATMLIGTNYTGGTIGLTTWDPEFARVQRRQPFLRQFLRTRTVGGMYIAWAEMANRDGAADTVVEGAAKPQIDFDIVESSKKVEKIAAWIKTSKEMLADIPYLASEINQELVESVELKLDSQLYDGNGTTPNLTGIKTYASTVSFTGTPFLTANGGVPNPNPGRAEAIVATAAVIRAQSFFSPNLAIVNPLDYAMIEMRVNSFGDTSDLAYVRSEGGGLYVGNIRVIENTGVPVGEFVVGDFTKDVLGIREEVNIQVGYVNDDFTKNLVTILAEMRAVNYVKTNHLGAFRKGVFATVIAAIKTA